MTHTIKPILKEFYRINKILCIVFLGTYIPRKEVVVEETVRATVIRPNQAIKLRARKETIDREGNPRVTGEEWLVKKTGAYLPGKYQHQITIFHLGKRVEIFA